MHSTESAIRAVSLSKTYRSGGSSVTVFCDLALEVRASEQIAIIGESGTGKSTLLHLLGGLDRPTSGAIFFGTREITTLRDSDLSEFRNREVGFVWQNPSLLAEFSAVENVAMPLLIRGDSRAAAENLASQRLEEVGLSARRRHRVGELSGGEQQRVGLARALVTEPKVLLADEPTGSLDFKTGESIIGLLAEMHKLHRLTSIFVTHNLSFARRCDRILQLDKGCLQPHESLDWQPTGVVQDATRLGGGIYV